MQEVFKHVFSFKGRLSRGQYFFHNLIMFLLFMHVIYLAKLGSLDFDEFRWVFFLSYAIIIISEISASVRRLHDLGYNSSYFFVLLIPFINLVYGLRMTFHEGESKNEFGEDPLELIKNGETINIRTYALIAVTLGLIIVLYYTFFKELL